MTEQELNRKLAEWAGFKYHSYEVYEYEHRDTRIEDPCWSNPRGQKCMRPPDFASSLDSCFTWLVPKLCHYEINNWGGGHRVWVGIVKENYKVADSETPALAICLAIEKLIDS